MANDAMGYRVRIQAVLCESCGWIMRLYRSGEFYCANHACEMLWVPHELRLEMHRKELTRRAS